MARSTATSRGEKVHPELKRLEGLLDLLRAKGVIRYKAADLELDLSMVPPQLTGELEELDDLDDFEPEVPVQLRRKAKAAKATGKGHKRAAKKPRQLDPVYDQDALYPDGEAPVFEED